MKKYNPYEIPIMKPEKPLRILFLTNSLHEEIKGNNVVMSKLHKLSEFDELDIWFSPTQNGDLESLISDTLGSKNCEYKMFDEGAPNERFAVFRSPGGIVPSIRWNLTENEDYQDLFESFDGSRINKAEQIVVNRLNDTFRDQKSFDLVVAHQDDLEPVSLTGRPNVVCIGNVMERIRLFMLNYRLFWIKMV